MASERLSVILELITGNYRREAALAAQSTGQIGTAAQTATRPVGGLTAALKKFVGPAAIIGAGVAMADFARDSIMAASDLEESINAVNVQYGEAAEGILALGENSVDSFGLSQQALNEFSVRFSAFGQNIAGSTGRDVVEVFEEMTTRVADFASVHNLTMEEAATIAQSTLAGETEAFRRFGGDVSAAAVELKGLEMGLGSSSEELTEQEKILIRYELFMEQTAKTAGDFANTSDSTANTLKRLNARFTETKARVGEALMPAFKAILDVAEDLQPAFEDFATETAELVSELGPLIGLLGDLVGVYSDLKGWARDAAGSQNEFERGLGRVVDLLMSSGLGILAQLIDAFQDMNPYLKEAGEKSGEAGKGLQFMADAAKDDLIPALSDAVGPIDSIRSAQQKAADATRNHLDALIRLSSRLAASINPAVAAYQALQDLEQAQIDSKTAAAEHGLESEEFAAAQLELAQQTVIANDALATFGLDADSSARAVATALGITEEAAQKLLDTLGLLDGTVINLRLDWEVEALEMGAIPEGLGLGAVSGIADAVNTVLNAERFQHGGVVSGPLGSPQLILAHGGETVLPTHKGNQSWSRSNNFYFGGVVQEPKPIDLQYLALLSNHQTFGKF